VTPHKHTAECAGRVPPCDRQWDVDPSTPTGSWQVVTRHKYGNRPKVDKPRWWPFVLIAYKAAVQVATVLGLAWLAKRLGLTVGAP